ncbi:hypothetical protein GCK72_010579 [Caenorhabditis remanei]|uniref:Uncharacterized protein n=1 Tax=Caenorhabditis remanei TaxID=31234 RepID=A0A6A5H547_CAERE|nr:hypothetical protein GCK72_010579 [Caenorhabditis remanei]KAF1762317.1 hypothetical protein GCK72_010579 [Caenorhabditis remanei]
MNDIMNNCNPNFRSEEPRRQLTLNGVSWPVRTTEETISAPPISPLSFAFMSEEERTALNFPGRHFQPEINRPGNISKSASFTPEPSLDSTPPFNRKTFKIDDLLVVDDDEDDDDSPPSANSFEPKAHLGWASFGESILPSQPPSPPEPAKHTSAPVPLKRKVYVVRQQNREKDTSHHVVTHNDNMPDPPKADSPPITTINDISDSDADVDVVGIDEDNSISIEANEDGNPPDLPPQSSIGSRFSYKSKKARFRYDSEEEEMINARFLCNISPPPLLEAQATSGSISSAKDNAGADEEKKCEDGQIEQRLGLEELNSAQILKTKVSSSTIPVLPLSKSIMERKKVAIEMTRHAVIKKYNSPSFKNFTVAPKSVQIPAYNDNTPMTLYSNINKPLNSISKDVRGRCVRCRDRSPVDMSTFKFIDDTTVVSVRAHLCDQTRVMIARTAMWNREYSKRLGDRAAGTVWQRPDEVTAQMTGFCSATKNELVSLKSTFGTEKFLGQTMRTPHVLTHYYAQKSQSIAGSRRPSSSNIAPPIPRMGNPPVETEKNEDEDRRHHPLTYYQPSSSFPSSTSFQSSSPSVSPPESLVPPLKKTVLRWTSIQTPRILRPPNPSYVVPKMAVIPVMKKVDSTPPKKEEIVMTGPRKRGRPRKIRPSELTVHPIQPSTRRLRSYKKELCEIDEDVVDVVEGLVSKVSGTFSINKS